MADQSPDPNQLFADPEFRALGSMEKIKVLNLDPEFEKLPPRDKGKVLAAGMYPFLGGYEESGKLKPGPGIVEELKGQARGLFQQVFPAYTPGGIDPQATTKGWMEAQAEQFEKARQAQDIGAGLAAHGHPIKAIPYAVESMGRDIAGILPFSGPAAAQTGEQYGTGQIGPAVLGTAQLLGPEAVKAAGKIPPFSRIPRVPGKFTIGPVKSRLTPIEAADLADFKRRGGKLSVGQEKGIVPLEKGERATQHILGSEPVAEKFFRTQEADLEQQARESIAQVSPVKLEDYESGHRLRGAFEAYVNGQKTKADQLYSLIREKAAKAKERVQTGWREVPGAKPEATHTPAGMPARVPVFEEFEAPVDLQPMQAQLRDLYQNFQDRLPEAQKQASPGFKALENIMTRKSRYMNAVDLDVSLGAIKELVRRGQQSRLLTTRAQGVGLRVIDAGEKQISQALEKASPGLSKTRERASQYVKEYHAADEMLQGLSPQNEPVQVYRTLTKAGDQTYELLTRINKIAPQELRTMGRTYLEGMLKEGFGRTGRPERTAGMLRDWNELGPKTKELLFGQKLTTELDSVFRNLRKLAPAEGSPTGWRLPILEALGVAGPALGLILTGHPVAGLSAAGGLAATALGMNVLARVLFSERGAELLNKSLTLPTGTGAFREVVRALGAEAVQATNAEREDRRRQQPEQTPRGRTESPPAKTQPRAALTSPRDLRQTLTAAAERHQLPPALMHAVAQTESSGRTGAVSPKGATGLMQLMPATARQYGVRDIGNVAENIEGSARFLRHLWTKYHGNVALVAAAYNAGEGAVDRYGGVPPYQETRQYVQRVMNRMAG